MSEETPVLRALSITPTVGRIVWYIDDSGASLAAIITHVWSDDCVNLAVFSADGVPFGKTSVKLLNPGATASDTDCCQWMPYQLGQAAKTEEAEAKLAEAKIAG